MLAALLALLALALPLASASESVHLTSRGDAFCLLDHEGAKCWSPACAKDPASDACRNTDAERIPALKPFANARRIVSGGAVTCVEKADASWECFGDLRTAAWRTALPAPGQPPVDLAIAKTHACTLRDGKVACWNANGSRRKTLADIDTSLVPDAPHSKTRAIAVSSNTTCEFRDRSVVCYVDSMLLDFDGRGPKVVSYDVTGATPASNDGGLLCMQATMLAPPQGYHPGPHVTCMLGPDYMTPWNLNLHMPGIQIGWSTPEFSNHLVNTRAIAAGRDAFSHYACVLDDAGVRCTTYARSPRPVEILHDQPIAALGKPRAIAMAGTMLCALSEALQISCVELTEGRPSTRVYRPAVQPLDYMQTLESELNRLADLVYPDKARFFQAAASTAALFPTRAPRDEGAHARLLILNLVRPVVEQTTTDHFRRLVIPAFNERLSTYNAAFGIRSLADFPDTSSVRTVFLRLAAAALDSTSDNWPASQRPAGDAVRAAIARALSQGANDASLAAVRTACTDAAPLFDTLAATPGTAGRGLLLLTVAARFRGL